MIVVWLFRTICFILCLTILVTICSGTADVPIIRHGRSRVRHSTEKDHLRWGLKAFDNLTLDYDYDNGTQFDTHNNQTPIGTISDEIFLQHDRINIFGDEVINHGGNHGGHRNNDTDLLATIKDIETSSFSNGDENRFNEMSTITTTTSTSTTKKRIPKKQIMANIRRDIDKGIEYLRTHPLNESINIHRKDLHENRMELIPSSPSNQNVKFNETTSNTLTTSRKHPLILISKDESNRDNERAQIEIQNKLNERNIKERHHHSIENTIVGQVSIERNTWRKSLPKDNNPPAMDNENVDIPTERKSMMMDSEIEVNANKRFNLAISNEDSVNVDQLTGTGLHDATNEHLQNDAFYSDIENQFTDNDPLGPTLNEKGKLFHGIDSESSIGQQHTNYLQTDDDNINRTVNYNYNIFSEIDENEFMEWDEISRKNRLNLMKGDDVVTRFLQIVESQHLLGANCTAGTDLNLGEGVVDRYAQDRFRIEAEIAVNRANMLTRIFKFTAGEVQASEHLLHASVFSMIEFDEDIFAAGNCFDLNQHPTNKGLFCPFAYRLPPPDQGALFAKDLATEYPYLGNTSEWFFLARKNAEKVIARNEQLIKTYHLYSNSTVREADEILSVKYEDGRWSKPYYDCGGGNIWMLTYTVPFFGYENGTYFFKGTSGIDIDLRRVDIDQCPQKYVIGLTQPLNIFAGTDKCKQRTTECEAIAGLGFRRGSYKCNCRKGFYFPDTASQQKYFNGSILEEEYEKLMKNELSSYSDLITYECLPCAEGCESCRDASPCIAALNWTMRTSILILACAVIGFLPPAAWFTFRYQQVKVVRAASPALLRVIALGAFFIYGTSIVMYPVPSLYTCTARVWLREIGFSLTYGALMLKTWRISVIFRVRSAKAVKITDAALLKRLGILCCVIGVALLVRTIVAPPEVVVGRTADDLKAYLCKSDWWDHTFTSMEILFLAWGVRLCILVRKAPSEFNESRFISMAIYNEFLLTCFLNGSMLFLQSPANPDLLYIIFFCHTQLTVTLLLLLIFGSKVYLVFRSGTKSQEDVIGMGIKPSGAKFICRSQPRLMPNPSTATSSTAQLGGIPDGRLTEQETLDEIRQLFDQLQCLQDRAPPRGIAVVTITSLLDNWRTSQPTVNNHNKLALKPPPTNGTTHTNDQRTFYADKSTNTNVINNEIQHTGTGPCTRISIMDESVSPTIQCSVTIGKTATGIDSLPLVSTSSSSSVQSSSCLDHQQSIKPAVESAMVFRQQQQQQSTTMELSKLSSNENLNFTNLELKCMCSGESDSLICHNCGNDLIQSNEINRTNINSKLLDNRIGMMVQSDGFSEIQIINEIEPIDSSGSESMVWPKHVSLHEQCSNICDNCNLRIFSNQQISNIDDKCIMDQRTDLNRILVCNRCGHQTKIKTTCDPDSELEPNVLINPCNYDMTVLNLENDDVAKNPVISITDKLDIDNEKLLNAIDVINESKMPISPSRRSPRRKRKKSKSYDTTASRRDVDIDDDNTDNATDTLNEAGGSESMKSPQKSKKPCESKLLVDLNDKSKYTKEVSV